MSSVGFGFEAPSSHLNHRAEGCRGAVDDLGADLGGEFIEEFHDHPGLGGTHHTFGHPGIQDQVVLQTEREA